MKTYTSKKTGLRVEKTYDDGITSLELRKIDGSCLDVGPVAIDIRGDYNPEDISGLIGVMYERYRELSGINYTQIVEDFLSDVTEQK